MLLAFRDMRANMIRQGLFRSSKSFYAWKIVSLLGMYMTVAAILLHGRDTWAATLAASCLLAACWQQSGWLAHDFLHHQVFKDRRLNNVFGYFMGNVLQGFSVDWWKNKHNKHHAVPNECTDNADAVDPGALRSARFCCALHLLSCVGCVRDCRRGDHTSSIAVGSTNCAPRVNPTWIPMQVIVLECDCSRLCAAAALSPCEYATPSLHILL